MAEPLTPDDKARLACAREADGDPDRLRELLDMLALWPGQERLRESSMYIGHIPGSQTHSDRQAARQREAG